MSLFGFAGMLQGIMSNPSHLSDAELLRYRDLYQAGLDHTVRFESVKTSGVDSKLMYHVVRLLGEIEQILTTGDLDLTLDRERLKAIRRGEWTLERIEEFFASKEKALEELYQKCELPWGPDEEAIKRLLLDCLEEHYGDLSSAVVQPDRAVGALRRIRDEIDNVRGLL